MLYELEPSKEVTGGAWYTESEFDKEFIKTLRMICLSTIQVSRPFLRAPP